MSHASFAFLTFGILSGAVHAGPPADKPPIKSDIAAIQTARLAQFRELEKSLLRMAQAADRSDSPQDRLFATVLREALAACQNRNIAAELTKSVELFRKIDNAAPEKLDLTDLTRADEHEKNLTKNVNQVIAILLAHIDASRQHERKLLTAALDAVQTAHKKQTEAAVDEKRAGDPEKTRLLQQAALAQARQCNSLLKDYLTWRNLGADNERITGLLRLASDAQTLAEKQLEAKATKPAFASQLKAQAELSRLESWLRLQHWHFEQMEAIRKRAMLHDYCEKTSRQQDTLHKETVMLHQAVMANPDKKPTRVQVQAATSIGMRQRELGIEIAKALKLAEENGEKDAVLDLLKQALGGMQGAEVRLLRHAYIDQATQELQNDTAVELRDLSIALVQDHRAWKLFQQVAQPAPQLLAEHEKMIASLRDLINKQQLIFDGLKDRMEEALKKATELKP